MNFITKLLGSKVAVTSAGIRNEIEKAENEAAALRDKIEGMLSGLAVMTDEQHLAAESNVAALRRAITRLEVRANTLAAELPAVIATEEAAQIAAKNDALRSRVEACRKANTVESKKLLTEFDKLASQMGDIFARLNEIADETNSVNTALKNNRVADSVTGYETLYRRHPAGHYELPLSTIVLPPAFAGGTAAWPRS
jgi:predicted  nucleic acid-binding Zn-ribbon protein